MQLYYNAVPYASPFQYPDPLLMETARTADEARTAQKEKEATELQRAMEAAASATTGVGAEEDVQVAVLATAHVLTGKGLFSRTGYDVRVRMQI
jgi:hypothetical protein